MSVTVMNSRLESKYYSPFKSDVFLVTFGTLAFEPITVLLSHSMLLMIVYRYESL